MTQDKLATMRLDYGRGMLLAMHLGRMKDTHGIALAQVSAGKLNNVRGALAIARTTRTVSVPRNNRRISSDASRLQPRIGPDL